MAGMPIPVPSTGEQVTPVRVYITPLVNSFPADLAADFAYMQEALQDEYQQTLPDYVTADAQVDW